MIDPTKFDYNLPKELIAQTPADPRDMSRLLIYLSEKNQIIDDYFYNLKKFINPGDLLVVNNSKVIPARLFGRKKTGGKIEILLVEQNGSDWISLIKGRVKPGDELILDHKLSALVVERNDKQVLLEFNLSGKKFWQKISLLGQAPIPPYIKNNTAAQSELIDEYQTIYAKKYGSAAAPTAGLHFSERLMKDLKSGGVDVGSVDLHVGPGTFAPLEDKNIRSKKLHQEKLSIPSSTVSKILNARDKSSKVVAVGTTTVRALESQAEKIINSEKNISANTDIFIQPGDKFQIVDGLITNFHLPKTSLMMLVAAFIEQKTGKDGREKLLELYNYAIKHNYRFYSFGDAMLII